LAASGGLGISKMITHNLMKTGPAISRSAPTT
jgi:hypothetical protein